MTPEGNIAEDVYSHYRIPHIYENPVPHEKDDSRTYWLIDIQPIIEW